jgi:hypothetical protein
VKTISKMRLEFGEIASWKSDFLPHDPAMMIEIFNVYGQTFNNVHRLVAGSARAFFGFR